MTKFTKSVIKLLIVLILLGGIAGYVFYKAAFSPNVNENCAGKTFYIPTGAGFQNVVDTLDKYNCLKNKKFFVVISKLKHYDRLVKSGKYMIDENESNWHLVNKLRSGNQIPVNVVVPSVRTLDKLCRIVAKDFEFSDTALLDLINNPETPAKYGFNKYNFACMFIPNTYQFYWNTTPEGFLDRMKKEYDNFWNDIRRQKAKEIGLTPVEVSILASIVQAEQMKYPDERPRIAGLYLNRLKKNMLLQSDPTVIFAIGDFTIKRVYDRHKLVNSPYNTYLYKGLPPGPILIPEISSIDAVLYAEKNNYLYMCAKDDLSGYHYFAENLTQHLINAEKYHKALNALKIY